MKKTNYKSIFTAWIFFISMLAMGGSIQGQNKVKGILGIENTCFKMNNKGDSLIISLNFAIKDEAINNYTSLRVIPMIESQDSTLTLPYIRIVGKKREHQNKRRFALASEKDLVGYRYPNKEILVEEGNKTTFDYYEQVPYQMWMDTAKFILQEEFSDYGSTTKIHRITINRDLNYNKYHTYIPQAHIAFLTPEKEIKMRKRQGRAYLDFPVGHSVLKPNFRSNTKELAKIDDAMTDVIRNEDTVIKGLFIEGYASPEGRFEFNSHLSRNRTNALKRYLIQKYNLKESMFTLNSVAEDWDGLVDLIQVTDMQYKDQILKIIAETNNPDQREQKLITLANGNPYREMLKELFPQLRRVEYRIDYQVRDYTTEKSKAVLSEQPELLSQLELYNLALSYGKDSKEYTNILIEVIPQYYSKDVTALNNAAAAMFENGELRTAKRYLDKAIENGGQNNAAVLNNLGVFNLLTGNLDKAEDCFDKSISMGCTESIQNKQKIVDRRRKDCRRIRH